MKALLFILFVEYRPALAHPRLYGKPAFVSAVSAAPQYIVSYIGTLIARGAPYLRG